METVIEISATTFGEIEIGTHYKYKGHSYIKTDMDYRGVNLKQGTLEVFENHYVVSPIKPNPAKHHFEMLGEGTLFHYEEELWIKTGMNCKPEGFRAIKVLGCQGKRTAYSNFKDNPVVHVATKITVET